MLHVADDPGTREPHAEADMRQTAVRHLVQRFHLLNARDQAETAQTDTSHARPHRGRQSPPPAQWAPESPASAADGNHLAAARGES